LRLKRRKLKNSFDFRRVADGLADAGDNEWAKKIYKKEEDKAEECYEYQSLAESIRDNLGDKKWAELLEQKAKELEDAE
jgi:hypothetical protein